MLCRRWAGGFLRGRHRPRCGSAHVLQELRKIAILEANTDKPVHARDSASSSLLASSPSLTSTSGKDTILQSLDSVLEAACDRVKFSSGLLSEATVSSSSTLLRATSLSHFLTECRRLRLEIGEARDANNRRRLRGTTRAFWAENVDGALACCALQGRDFGFVAGFGLIDDALHLCFSSLQLALQCVAREKSTCPCTSMMLALHYMVRELDHLEKKAMKPAATHPTRPKKTRSGLEEATEVKPPSEGDSDVDVDGAGAGAGATSVEFAVPTTEELRAFRRSVATLGVERLHLFFIERGESGRVLGSAEDALHALEFLTTVKLDDANESARALIEEKKPRWCQSSEVYLVTSLFRHVVHNGKELKFTSVVHAFRLLRIFMPLLTPPPPLHSSSSLEQEREPNCVHMAASPNPDSAAAHTATYGAASILRPNPEYSAWQAQRDTVDRIIWGLFTTLRRKDARFVNSFHFVQIMATVSQLPSYFLSRVPPPRRRAIKNLEFFAVTTCSGAERTTSVAAGATRPSRPREGGNPTTAEEMWEYMIAKACIFIPGLTSDQRRRVCRNLRLAVQRREGYFERRAHGDKNRRPTLSAVETLLLPMAHELSQYPKDYEAAMFDSPPGEKQGNVV
ncbi:uncharacterized protein Tco025E_04848 [Trypanosoma conorhini]|uniref:Uncharacterized protein n=1 Tax=Trypanosoma conorhini TaxID=83891 RepID=A0A422PIC2_9TRYP|nr:uncharacterized protein Tco025E_04848 [Trypanosoma conorhini]RNF17431.1 hypothetical protein Tco025E_04848 [Trypanosoma conorhini]